MKKITILFLIFILLPSCQSTKDAFTLKKKSSSDEFLVEKKSPLVLPPNYGELPLPDNQQIDDSDKNQDDIKLKLTKDLDTSSKQPKNLKPTSIEKSILEKIK
tara:strand:+ start:405 stop:713 length:309 start_codon:yes stop_codon:yes gene_type:complete